MSIELWFALAMGALLGFALGFGVMMAVHKRNKEQELEDYFMAGYQTGLRRGKFKAEQERSKKNARKSNTTTTQTTNL
jgi:hypothetical protein